MLRITFVRRSFSQYLWIIAQGFGSVLDGLVMIFSLGLCVSNFNLSICGKRTQSFLKALIREQKARKLDIGYDKI